MDCKAFLELMDALPDGQITQEELSAMKRHAENCDTCREKWRLVQDLRAMNEETEAPEAFSAAWRRQIRKEESAGANPRKKKNWMGVVAAAAALVFIIGGTAATRGSLPAVKRAAGSGTPAYSLADSARAPSAANAVYTLGANDLAAAEESWADAGSAMRKETGEQPAKIIKSARFTLKTMEFEATLAALQELTASYGGRVEALNRRGDAESGEMRSASLTLRVPAEQLDDFLNGTGQLGNVTDFTQQAQDVSDSYYDLKNRLITQQEKLERLRALMARAEDVADLIEIENAVADTQYLIDAYTAQLNGYDSRADDSTVEVTVREVRPTEVKEATLGERIREGFADSLQGGLEFLQDMAVFLAAALPWLAGIGALIAVFIGIRRKLKKRKE